MPAAEAMTVRTRRGIQTLPRRVALAMLSSGRASKVTSEEVAADQARVREEYQRVLSERAERARVTGLPVPGVTDAQGDAEDASTGRVRAQDRKSTRLNSSHVKISYAVFCLKRKKTQVP